MNPVFYFKSGGDWEKATIGTKCVQQTIWTQSSTLNLNMESPTEDVFLECLHALGPMWPPALAHVVCMVDSAPVTHLFNEIM